MNELELAHKAVQDADIQLTLANKHEKEVAESVELTLWKSLPVPRAIAEPGCTTNADLLARIKWFRQELDDRGAEWRKLETKAFERGSAYAKNRIADLEREVKRLKEELVRAARVYDELTALKEQLRDQNDADKLLAGLKVALGYVRMGGVE